MSKQERERKAKFYHETAEKIVTKHFKKPFQIDCDFQKVSFGKIELNKYWYFSSFLDFIQKVNEEDNRVRPAAVDFYREIQTRSIIAENIFYTRLFGMPPTWFYNHVKTALYQAFVGWMPPDLVVKLFIKNNKLDIAKINSLTDAKLLDLILEVYRDDLLNIAPIVLEYKKDPKTLKKYFGNENWKILSKNTIDRNKGIVKVFQIAEIKRLNGEPLSKDAKAIVKEIALLPTTILKASLNFYSYGMLLYAAKHYRGKWNKLKLNNTELNRDFHTYNDLVRMKGGHGNYRAILETINWSPRRVKEEHENLIRIEIAKKYSTDSFKWLENFPIKRFESNGFTSELLMSPAEIGNEGVIMNHCVGSYAKNVEEMNYLIFSVKDSAGMRYSTIGVNVTFYKPISIFENKNSTDLLPGEAVLVGPDAYFVKPTEPGAKFKFIPNQHYKAFNQVVRDPAAIDHHNNLLKVLNEFGSEYTVSKE